MRGAAARGNATPQPAAGKKRVLFVCIGNSCRSQMAEALARVYGADVLVPSSAGLYPAMIVAPLTRQVLTERNIPVDELFPKGLDVFGGEAFDVLVNMSGLPLPESPVASARVLEWPVTDPIGQKESVYQEVCGRIEALVMGLVLELRAA